MLLAAVAGPVAANRTGRGAVHVSAGAYDFTITSDIGCAGFDVLVEDIAGTIKEVVADKDGQRTKTMFHTVTRYTNTETGASITRPFNSIGHSAAGSDGSTEIKALGDTLIWGPEPVAIGLAPGIWLVEDGRLSLAYDPAGNLTGITLHRGTTFDVCAALAPPA